MIGKRKKAAKKPRTVEMTVTYLRMDAHTPVNVHPPANHRVTLMQAHVPPVHFYRYLYDTIGHGYVWIDRRLMSDDDLAAIINDPAVAIYVAYADGCPAGYFEIDARNAEEVWIAYFGIMPEHTGKGFGKWLFAEALAVAWEKQPGCVKIETCTLDHPGALPLYQRMGFVPYDRRHKISAVPEGYEL